MSKAILVMDMPETCEDCRLCALGMTGRRCYGRELSEMILLGDMRLPNCPLVPAIGYVEPVGNMISWEDDGDE